MSGQTSATDTALQLMEDCKKSKSFCNSSTLTNRGSSFRMSLRRLPAVKVGRIYNEATHFPLNKLFSSEQVQDLQGGLHIGTVKVERSRASH